MGHRTGRGWMLVFLFAWYTGLGAIDPGLTACFAQGIVGSGEAASDDGPLNDAPTPPSLIPEGAATTSAPLGPPKPPRTMGTVEQGVWTAARALASTAGATVGSAVGIVAVPAAVTAIVGALGISTAGTGFVAAVLIPATPMIGKILGSAIGAGLFSGVVITAYEIRMQAFRAKPKTRQEIAKDVAKAAGAEALLAPITVGLGGGATAATGETLKRALVDILKKAGIRIVGEVAIQVITRKLLPTEPYPPMEGTGEDVPPGISPGDAPVEGTGTASMPQDPGPQGYNPLAGHPDRTVARSQEEPTPNGDDPDLAMSRADSVGPGREGEDATVPHGFSPEIEKAVRVAIFSEPLAEAGSLISRTMSGGIGLRISILIQLSKLDWGAKF